MALHPEFPTDPQALLDPKLRWFPADEAQRDSMEKLMPPLVARLRVEVKAFRDSGYAGAKESSRSLLTWWFNRPHLLEQADGTMQHFSYYFAQQEAVETIIYLHDVVAVQDHYDLLRFDASGLLSSGMFNETWRRFVVKMATGSGKTKVLTLILAWSFYHKLYEPDSDLARNFLVIAPNIIVLDRIFKDFQGLRIFFQDPVLPENGFAGRNWRDDFQLTLHLQDEVRVTRPTGNIFLTNIHRVYAGEDIPPSPEDDNSRDYFLGKAPKGKTTDSKVDLAMIVRDIDELLVLNDEAHHIHDERLAWFKSIEDIHLRLVHKGRALAMQVDVTATPRHNNGALFAQTVSDYPLVEAIAQNVVKHPVLPDAPSRAKLQEGQSIKFTEKYADYLHLGVIEWRKAAADHAKMGKKAILFVMTDDTRNCDDVAAFLETRYPDLHNAVLVIHTKKNGEISEASSSKDKDALERLRQQASGIDSPDNPYKAIVSVMMLKEGWDVKNVTTIVGLRAYSAKSNILPEQTLGRGLRKMYSSTVEEYVSVIGTAAFMDFVESIQAEGVVLEHKRMGEGSPTCGPLLVEVDKSKDLEGLDIELPVLSPRIYREYKSIANLDIKNLGHTKLVYRHYPAEKAREIVFKDITSGEITHRTLLDDNEEIDYRSVLGYFARTLLKDLRLVSGYDLLYPLLKRFVQTELFQQEVDLEDPNTLRNLAELRATKTLFETLKQGINALSVHDSGHACIHNWIKLRQARPFVVKEQSSYLPRKSLFNRIVGDSRLELDFAVFLDKCADVVAFAKNSLALGFRLDYVNAEGDLSYYYPDFFVKCGDKQLVLVETKGLETKDVPLKMARLRQWCEDVNQVQQDQHFDFVYVEEERFVRYQPQSFHELMENFSTHKEPHVQA